MIAAPPPYPRISHLVGGRGTDDDRVLGADEVRALLDRPVVVEEKLDGANVVLWLDGRRLECSLRSGPHSADRAGQLGPLRAWVAEHTDELRALVSSGEALYGEWLYLTHSLPYDRLPSYFVALDLLEPAGHFAAVDYRNSACSAQGVATPAELYRGVPRTLETVETLLGPSRYGPKPMEGVVVRALGWGEPRLAKLLREDFTRVGDEEWARGRPRNRLADREQSWR